MKTFKIQILNSFKYQIIIKNKNASPKDFKDEAFIIHSFITWTHNNYNELITRSELASLSDLSGPILAQYHQATTCIRLSKLVYSHQV